MITKLLDTTFCAHRLANLLHHPTSYNKLANVCAVLSASMFKYDALECCLCLAKHQSQANQPFVIL